MMNDFKKTKIKSLARGNVKNHQKAFTLIELMISLAIGVVLLAGIVSVFVGMKTTVKETSTYGELQENARFAISVLTDDLLQQGFFGDYAGLVNFATLEGRVPAIAGVECIGGGTNNGTYPLPLLVGDFRTLWGETSSNLGATRMSCINDAAVNSDVIQFKRVISNPLASWPAFAPTPNGFAYFVSNFDKAAIYRGAPVPVIANSRTWQYQHHIYYVRQGDPVLMKWRLTTEMINEPIVDGIERIYFMYGVSTVTDPGQNGYGVINAYISADDMTDALWDNITTKILAVKIYVLARSILPDNDYNNVNTYVLGDQDPYIPADNFRRLLLTSTVTLYNSEKDVW